MSLASPSVSIVIPAYNEQLSIGACILAALDQTVPANEIIVVDNKSTDDTAAIVKALQAAHPDAPIIYFQQNDVQGLIPTRNFGMDRAQSDVIGRIDADSLLEPTWVEEVQRMFTDETVAGGTGPVLYYDMPLRRFGLKADDALRRAIIKVTRDFHFLFGSNMAVRASVWRLIRDEVCLDVADDLHEDVDISIHLHERDLKIAYSSAMVTGMSARRIDDSPREYYNYVMRFERTFKQHDVRKLSLRAPMAIFLSVYPAAKAMRNAQARKAAQAL